VNNRLRVAVIGVGHLGQHHARLLASLDDVDLVGVVDIKPGRADEIAAKYGTKAWPAAADLIGCVDAVTIAVPTVAHLDVALPFLDRGIAVLVEKPPAVVAALPLLANPRFVEVHRLGTFPERSLDIDVIFDLMIHDLDLLLAAVQSEVVSIETVGVNVLTPKTDIANARLRFASGCIANVTASRISRERVRKVRFFQRDSYVSIDYAAQEVEVYKLAPRGSVPPIQGGKLDVINEEPLKRELVDFVHAVRNRREPGVTGRAGRDALELATRIAEKMTQ
jgi:predicted dehydrogenase